MMKLILALKEPPATSRSDKARLSGPEQRILITRNMHEFKAPTGFWLTMSVVDESSLPPPYQEDIKRARGAVGGLNVAGANHDSKA